MNVHSLLKLECHELSIYLKSLFRCEKLLFRAKNTGVEDGYPEGNLTKLTHFAAEKVVSQQNMEIGDRYLGHSVP